MFTRLNTCILLALAASSFTSNAKADTFDSINVFGDSLSDAGNVFLFTGGSMPAAPYSNGRFSNGNVWVQDLATALGVAPLTPSIAGGTDYAAGSAQSGVTIFNPSPTVADLPNQLSSFKTANPTGADPKSLYTIWIGSNDLGAIPANASGAQIALDTAQIIGNIDGSIATLAGLGAKNFLVVTVPDLGKGPAVLAAGALASAEASALSAGFDNALVNGFAPASIPSLNALAAGDQVNISVLDSYSLLDSIVASPGSFGLSNVTSPCYTGTYAGFADTLDPGTVCSNPNQYLFWDTLHPTAATHEIIASAALDVVTPEPNSLVLVGGAFALLLLRRRYCAGNR